MRRRSRGAYLAVGTDCRRSSKQAQCHGNEYKDLHGGGGGGWIQWGSSDNALEAATATTTRALFTHTRAQVWRHKKGCTVQIYQLGVCYVRVGGELWLWSLWLVRVSFKAHPVGNAGVIDLYT